MKNDKRKTNQPSFLTTDAEIKEEKISAISNATEANFESDSEEVAEHGEDTYEHSVPEEAKRISDADLSARLSELRSEKMKTRMAFKAAEAKLKAAKKNSEGRDLALIEAEFNAICSIAGSWENVNCVAADAEITALESDVVSGILNFG